MSVFDKLPQLPFGRKLNKTQYFFALNISAQSVIAAVWEIDNKKLHIHPFASAHYEGEDNLIEMSNKVLDEVLEDFEYEPNKILFGVPDNWLQDDNLKEDSTKLLKRLMKELDVVPLAYVSSTFAIAHLYQKQEGAPLTAIVINLEDPLTVSLVKGGKILGSKTHKRTDNLPQDIEKALLNFSDVEVMPSKISVYSTVNDKEELNRFKDELQAFSWMTNLPFLHLPKIEMLNSAIELEAVCLAGASELEPGIQYHPHHLEAVSVVPSIHHTKPFLTDEPVKDKENLAELGFVKGDIEEKDRPTHVESFDQVKKIDHSTESDLVDRSEVELEEEAGISQEESSLGVAPRFRGPLVDGSSRFPLGLETVGKVVQKLISLPSGIFRKRSFGVSTKESYTHQARRGQILNKFTLATLVLILGIGAAYVFLPKAEVTIYIDPKILEKDAQIIADPALSAVNESEKKIPGKIVEIEVSVTDKGQATGKKQIGDPAKGRVIIYNKTNSAKTFKQGDILVGLGNLSYFLDTGVTIASQSAFEGGISFGKATAPVTASAIGPEGNLPSGKELSLKGESNGNYSAKVDQDITGGTSKDVSVVTADDQKKLLAKVSDLLRSKAQEEIQGKLTGDSKILQEALDESITKTTYSKGINETASEFNLNASGRFKGVAYSHSDLKTVVGKLVETNVPEGFMLNLQDTETQADVVKMEKTTDRGAGAYRLIFQAKFKAKLFPKLDLEKIKQEIKGKTPAQVTEIVRKNDTVIESMVKTSLMLPASLQRLPLLARNISIQVVPK